MHHHALPADLHWSSIKLTVRASRVHKTSLSDDPSHIQKYRLMTPMKKTRNIQKKHEATISQPLGSPNYLIQTRIEAILSRLQSGFVQGSEMVNRQFRINIQKPAAFIHKWRSSRFVSLLVRFLVDVG